MDKSCRNLKPTRTFFPFYVEEKVGTTTTAIKYYTFNGLTIAMKRGSDLRYLHSDHLGSNSVVTNADGTVHSSQDYCAYGGQRIATMFGEQCDPTAVNPLPTDRTFTGQEQDGTGRELPGRSRVNARGWAKLPGSGGGNTFSGPCPEALTQHPP